MPNNYLLKKKEIRVRPPHSDFVNLQRPRQCAPTKEASSHQGCAADVAQTRQRLHAGSACCDHRTRISSICRDLGNAHQRRRQAATKAAPSRSLKRVSSRMQTQFSASATGCKLRLLSLPRNPSATTALGFRQFAETSTIRTNEGGKQPPRLRRRRRPNAAAAGCKLSFPRQQLDANSGCSACPEIRVRPPRSDFVNLQRPRQCAPTKEASSHQGCAADVA